MYQLDLSLITFSEEKFVPRVKVKNSFLLYKFDRSTNLQAGFFAAPLGYYYDNLRKFSFMETTFGTLNLKSLYIGGLNGSFYSDSVNFGTLLNKRLNSRLNVQLAINFPNSSFENLDSKNAFTLDNVSGVANLIYKANPYEAFVTYSYRNRGNNEVYSTAENDTTYFSNTRSNLFGLGGKTHFKVKKNRKILVKVQGETWFTNRNYIPALDTGLLGGFGYCLKFWDCPQETALCLTLQTLI